VTDSQNDIPTKVISAESVRRAREQLDIRHCGVVWLDGRAVEAMLRLPAGQRVVSIHADWLRYGIGLMIEGEGLPECAPEHEPVRVDPQGYVDLHLVDKVRALAERWTAAGTDDGLHALLIATLTGRYDPRVELPS
jgi:hypothetical protein